jgi:Domain of unknown function (DUF1996)
VALLTACVALGALPATAPADGVFSFGCKYARTLADDPIVFPARPGASHDHDFIGNLTTDAFSHNPSLRAGAHTCTLAGDHSAYWIPSFLQRGSTGLLQPIRPIEVTLYYHCDSQT